MNNGRRVQTEKHWLSGHTYNGTSSRCKVWKTRMKYLCAIVMAIVMSACTTEFEEEAQHSKIESITTLPADQAPATEGVVTVQVTESGGYTYLAQADSDNVIVKFKPSTSSSHQNSILSAASISRSTALPIVSGLTRARLAIGQSIEDAVQSLSNDPAVTYAEPEYIVATSRIPNDSRFGTQWALNNTGQTGGSRGADINAPAAWDLHTGSNVVIAVIDTGVEYNHSDLVGNIWSNTGEIPDNGRDDDGNGFVDDVRGWDFANNDNNPVDDHAHGTHVAGIIGGRGNNGNGIAGVNWSVRIMPLKFMNANGQGSTFAAIRAIEYAVANGAQVSNNSWGGPGFSRALYDAIAAANSAGHVFVAAAGNRGRNNDSSPEYPSSFNLRNIISVAATTNTDGRAGFSNYGLRTVDLGAPGVRILSTVRGNTYQSFSGTSMAAPFVTGAAGLLLAAQPGLSVSGVKSALMDNVDPVSGLNGRTVSGGRLNLFAALSDVMSGAAAPVTLAVNPGTATLQVGESVLFTASGGTSPYSWSVSNSSFASISSTGQLSANAAGALTVTATDSAGNTGASGNIIITAQTPQVPDPVVLAPMAASMGVGQSLRFTATGGVTPFSWSSSNPAVASIGSATGVLTALAAGSVRVTAIDNAGTTTVTNVITITRLGITPAAGVLSVNDSLQLSATGGTAPFSWRSSNTAVIQVSSSGLLLARAAGSAVITVTDGQGATANTGTVPVRSISITPGTGTLQPGQSLQLTASGGATPYRWSVSNPSVATISSAGLLMATTPGTVRVSVSDVDGIAASSGTITVGNSNTSSSAITITPNTANVVFTGWKLFTASGGTPPYRWSLRDTTAGFIYSDVWPGWFLANGSIGSTTTIVVVDADGNTVESGTVNTISQ